MSKEDYDSFKESRSRKSGIKYLFIPLGFSSIFSTVRNKLSDIFFLNKEDGQEEGNSLNFNNNFHKEHFNIKPGIINENEHIYDAPSLITDRDDRHDRNDRNERNEKDSNFNIPNANDYSSRISLDKKSDGMINRRFSIETSRTLVKKKINPLLKIATYITNRKFNNVKKKEYSNNKSAFKIVDSDNKSISLDNKKIINYNDFNQILLERNLIRPVPIKKEFSSEFRATCQKRDRERDAMSVDKDSESSHLKKRKLNEEEKSIFSSVGNLNRIRNIQRDDVSMHSMNSVLATSTDRRDVSMRGRPEAYIPNTAPPGKKTVITKSYQSKTLDEIRKEIEEKRGVNKRIFDDLSKRRDARYNKVELDYEEKKRNLMNYYQEKDKRNGEVNLINSWQPRETREIRESRKNNFFNISERRLSEPSYDNNRDKNFSVSKTSITITASPKMKKKEAIVFEKNEELKIYPSLNEIISKSMTGITNTHTPSITSTFTTAPKDSTNEVFGNKIEEKSTSNFFSAFSESKNNENKNFNLLSNVEASKINLTSESNNLTDKKEKVLEKVEEKIEKKEEKQPIQQTLFSGLAAFESNKLTPISNASFTGSISSSFGFKPLTTTDSTSANVLFGDKNIFTDKKDQQGGFIFNKLVETTKTLEKIELPKPAEEKKEEKKLLFSGLNYTKKDDVVAETVTNVKQVITVHKEEAKLLSTEIQKEKEKEVSLPPSGNTTAQTLFKTPFQLTEPAKIDLPQDNIKTTLSTSSSLFGSLKPITSTATSTVPEEKKAGLFDLSSTPSSITSTATTPLFNTSQLTNINKPSTTTEVPSINIPSLSSGLFASQTPSGSSLMNSSNPFISAGNNPTKPTNTLFTSPNKPTDNEQSSSQNIYNKNSLNSQNRKGDMFNTINPQDSMGSSNINAFNTPNIFNKPLLGSNLAFVTSNTNTMNTNMNENENDMAISPITSPKMTCRTEGISQPSSLFGGFTPSNIQAQTQPQNLFGKKKFNLFLGTGNLATPSFGNTNNFNASLQFGSNTTQSNQFNMPQGGFGQNLFGQNQGPQTFGTTTPGQGSGSLKFSLGKKDK